MFLKYPNKVQSQGPSSNRVGNHYITTCTWLASYLTLRFNDKFHSDIPAVMLLYRICPSYISDCLSHSKGTCRASPRYWSNTHWSIYYHFIVSAFTMSTPQVSTKPAVCDCFSLLCFAVCPVYVVSVVSKTASFKGNWDCHLNEVIKQLKSFLTRLCWKNGPHLSTVRTAASSSDIVFVTLQVIVSMWAFSLLLL